MRMFSSTILLDDDIDIFQRDGSDFYSNADIYIILIRNEHPILSAASYIIS